MQSLQYLNLGGRTNMRFVRHMHSVGMLALVAGMPLTYTVRDCGTRRGTLYDTGFLPSTLQTAWDKYSGAVGNVLPPTRSDHKRIVWSSACVCDVLWRRLRLCDVLWRRLRLRPKPLAWCSASPPFSDSNISVSQRLSFLFPGAVGGTWGAARLALVRVPWGLATERSPCCGSSGHKSTKASPPSALRRAQPQVRRLRTAHSGDGGHNPLVHPVWCVPS